jgi:hypothetical protein
MPHHLDGVFNVFRSGDTVSLKEVRREIRPARGVRAIKAQRLELDKREGRPTKHNSRAGTLTLFYTRGLGIVVVYVMVPKPYGFSFDF